MIGGHFVSDCDTEKVNSRRGGARANTNLLVEGAEVILSLLLSGRHFDS